MADWRDNLERVRVGTTAEGKPKVQVGGSFRGVAFFVDSHEFVSGRRKADHEFPERDISRSEDLGRKIRKFSLNLFVLGDDYFEQRDALLEALEKGGSGELIHPYLGRKSVQVGNFTLSESSKEGRIAKMTVDFTETGEALFPDQNTDAKSATDAAADAALDESENIFSSLFSVALQPEHVIDSATASLNFALDFLTDSVAKFTEPVSEVTFAVLNLKQSAELLVRSPATLAASVRQTFELLLASVASFGSLQKILNNYKNMSLPDIIGTTPSADKARDNDAALEDMFKQQAHCNEAKVSIEIDFNSVDEAIRIRDGIIAELTLQLGKNIGDDLFQNLRDLQAAIAGALPPLTVGTLLEFTPPKTLPALVIAHSLFQDLDKETEIVEQNGVVHPGFVPGGQPLEVSSG